MEEFIKDKCDLYGISPSVLTDQERAELIAEIQVEQQGKTVLDSVLDNPEIRYRGLM